MHIYDLTFDIMHGMMTCGTQWHQTVEIIPLGTLSKVGRNTHRIVLGSHSGTHMDAPYHFIENGETVDTLAVECMWGPVSVVDFRHKQQGDVVTLNDVKRINVAERLLFAFGWYHKWNTDVYYKNFPCFHPQAVEYLISRGMKLMAMDTPSPDTGDAIGKLKKNDSPNHKLLLSNKVIIVEYLNNTDCLNADKNYELVALPLKIYGIDGAPARVLIKEL